MHIASPFIKGLAIFFQEHFLQGDEKRYERRQDKAKFGEKPEFMFYK